MKLLKRGLLLLLILLLCIVVSWFIFKKYYLHDMVQAGIEKSIDEQIENKFEFTFDDFKINIVSSKAQLIGCNLLLFNQKDTVGFFRGNLLVDLKGWSNLLFDKQKRINNISLKEAELYYAEDYPLIMKNKDGNVVQEVAISNVNAAGKLLLAKKHNEQSGLLATKFDFTAALNYNTREEIIVEQLINQVTNFQLSQFHYYLPDGYYQLMVAEVAFSKFDNIVLKQAIINPIHSKKVFAQKKKVATDFISLSVDSIQLLAFDSRVNEQIFIDKINLYQPNIDMFKDKNFPDNQEYKALFVDLLQELKTPVYIRAVELNNMFIKYSELANEAKEAGYLFFRGAKAKISNITNVKDSIQISNILLVEAEAKLFSAGILKTYIQYDLLSTSGQYSAKGSLSPMDIRKANTIISKVLPAKIKSGQLDKLHFNFSGTRIHSAGEMWFEYSDLKLEVLELNNLNNKFTRKIVSSLGNKILRNSNPAANGTFRVGAINQDRDTTKSMFNYWWISLRSGFLSTLGMKDEIQVINYKSRKDATFLDKIGLGKK